MKHWHLCERWKRAGFENPCPLSAFADHEEEDDDDTADDTFERKTAKDKPKELKIFAERKPGAQAGEKAKTLEQVINEILLDVRSQAVVKALGQGVPVVPTGVPKPPTLKPAPAGLPSEEPHFAGGGPGTGIPGPAKIPTAAAAALNTLIQGAGAQSSGVRTADIAERAITETINRFVDASSGITANEIAQTVAVFAAGGAGAIGVAGGGFFVNAAARMKALLGKAGGDFKLTSNSEGPNSEEEFFSSGSPGT